MLINPAVLLETLRTVPGVDEFQVVLRKQDPADPFSMDEMVVRVATARHDREALSQDPVAAAQRAIRVRPRVEFTTADDMARAPGHRGPSVDPARAMPRSPEFGTARQSGRGRSRLL